MNLYEQLRPKYRKTKIQKDNVQDSKGFQTNFNELDKLIRKKKNY